MANQFGQRLKHAWNVITNRSSEFKRPFSGGYSSGPPDRVRNFANDKTIVPSIYNRISVDVAGISLYHVKVDSEGGYSETIHSGLNYCLTEEANADQAARHFRQDIVLSLFEYGVIAVVPVDTTLNPNATGAFDIKTMRVGRIVDWEPKHVWVNLYNEETGLRQDVRVAKKFVAIIENPFYSVMNEPNSTLQRLVRKLNLLDTVDEQISSGKLDLIIQLPYVIKTDTKRLEAENRRKDIEMQLSGSKYGIAYTDGTERITQLNRPAENHMLKQVEYLIDLLYTQLGITKEVFSGTAEESVMINYTNRTVEPILVAITEAMSRSFLTKTARTQGHKVVFYRDPFRLASLSALAEAAEKLIRNEVVNSNEIRKALGLRPVKGQKANMLSNPNMPFDKQAPDDNLVGQPQGPE